MPARRRSSGANATARRCAVAHPARRACGPPQDEVRKKGLTLRACESFDFGDSRHESKQALTTRQIAESRIDSQTLRSAAQQRVSKGEARAVSGSNPAHAEVLHLEEFLDAVLGALAADAGFLDAAEGGHLGGDEAGVDADHAADRKSTRLNSSH